MLEVLGVRPDALPSLPWQTAHLASNSRLPRSAARDCASAVAAIEHIVTATAIATVPRYRIVDSLEIESGLAPC